MPATSLIGDKRRKLLLSNKAVDAYKRFSAERRLDRKGFTE
jgi:hypothetical protein